MFKIPPKIILSWPTPDYENPIKRGSEMWIVSGLFLLAATVCVSVRLWVRIFVRKWFGVDDLLIVLAFLCSIGVTALVAIGNARYDWDRHIWDMPVVHFSSSAKVLYLSRIFWGLASSFVRLSVLCLYYRLAKACEAPRYFYTVLHGSTAFTVGLLLYYFLTGLVPCIPIHAYWTWPTPSYAKCIHDGVSMQVAGVLNTFSEFVLATLPLIAVFRLHVDKDQRWSVIGVLSLGFLVTIAGCFRTFYIWKVLQTLDLTWWSGPQWTCSEVEIDLALICACAAPIRPLISRLAKRFRKIQSPATFSSLKPSLLGSQSASATQSSNMGPDASEVKKWTTMMSRTIDLEGIANDGFGYTVTISGPKKRFRIQEKLREQKMSLAQIKEKSSGKAPPEEKKELEIPMKTEVSVRESWHSTIGPKRAGWGSVVPRAGECTFADVENSIDFAEPWDESLFGQDLPEIRSYPEVTEEATEEASKGATEEATKGATEGATEEDTSATQNLPEIQSYLGAVMSKPRNNRSAESIEALPQMPPPVTHPTERPLRGISSFLSLRSLSIHSE